MIYEDESVSGRTLPDGRPGLQAAIDKLEREKARLLVVSKRDRLAEGIIPRGQIERMVGRAGATVVSADENPGALLFIGNRLSAARVSLMIAGVCLAISSVVIPDEWAGRCLPGSVFVLGVLLVWGPWQALRR
ncbi:MAG: recombinase family protein [Deltaproteobacteria bacterium]|nr:recombinase family protein [Deltaproteobacteria bacterium]